MFLQQSITLLTTHPNLTIITVAVLFVIGVHTVLVAVAALVAISTANPERGKRAHSVLRDLLAALGRGGRR